jgi:hypothetical protein
LWCGGGHLHRKCPEKTNAGSTPRCCNCTLVEGEKPHPASYRGCSHAKGEQKRRRAQRGPKGFSRRTFFAKFTSAEQSYAAAIASIDQIIATKGMAERWEKRATPLSVASATVGISENGCHYRLTVRLTKLKVATVVRQIMRELSEYILEEDKVMIVTMLVLDLMQRNGC